MSGGDRTPSRTLDVALSEQFTSEVEVSAIEDNSLFAAALPLAIEQADSTSEAFKLELMKATGLDKVMLSGSADERRLLTIFVFADRIASLWLAAKSVRS